ncbi:MAG: energy-coupling factor transporter ATPase [Clostridia bacterium]
MSIVQLNNVKFEYQLDEKTNLLALDDITLSIEEGSFVALVGHNGSGKSTLAKLLNGLLLPMSGNVTVDGIDTQDEKKVFEIRKNVGMVFQNPDNQMVASIVEDDIAFGPENLGLPREETARRVAWALEQVGMSEHRYGTPFKMSGGQKQRLAIAGVLAIMPKIMVLDESTAMLDPKGRREVLEVAHQLNKTEKMTIILITHYMDEALGADRVIVMNDGKIALDGAPKDIFREYDTLKSCKLTVPLVTDIAYNLNKLGMDIDSGIIDEEELVNTLCQLL